MAFTNYSDLQTSVASWLGRDDLTERIKDFIELGEVRLRRTLRIREMLKDVTATTTSGDSTVGLPSDFLEVRDIHVSTNPIQPLDFLTPSEQLLFSKALTNIIDTSYKSDRIYNDSAYEIAKIIVNSDIITANNLILVVNKTSSENNNSKNLSSNILYNISKLNSKKIDELSDDISNELIKQSLNELENDIVIKKTKVKKKIDFENNFSQTPLIAISSSVLSVNKSLTEKIADNIIKSNLKKKDELSFKLAQQTNILDDWQNNENKEIIESKSKFVEKIFPEAFKNINEEKMEFAIEIVLNSDLATSNKTIEAVVDSYIDNNNNFFKVEKDFLEKMQDVIKATKINNNQFARNEEEAEIILKSFYTDPISPTVLNNPQLAYVYAGFPIEKFEQFSNVSPN